MVTANRTRRKMQHTIRLSIYLGLICGVTFSFAGADMPSKQTVDPPAKSEFQTIALPFLQTHCFRCHDEKRSQAGFRIDLLSGDFTQPKMAEHWKEVIDRINAGEMPPKSRPRPDVKAATAFVDWVQRQLRKVELAAKDTGGRIPMRRLNRDEYANTVRDLLQLDELFVRPLIEELPGDGKAEGFDRLGVALFFDQTQIERSLSVAKKIAARAIVTEPPQTKKLVNKFAILRLRPPSDNVPVFPGFKHTIPRGAKTRFIKPEFIEYIQGSPTYRREYDGWGSVQHFAVSRVVTQNGYYRIRIKAKVDQRGRKVQNKFILQYAFNSPIQAETKVDVNPSGITEAVMFFNGPVNGEVKGPQVFRLLWNHNEDAIINEPKYRELFSRWTRLRGLMERAAAKRVPKAEMKKLKDQRSELEKEMNAWQGQAYIYNPKMDVDKLARLQIEWIEIEGPIQKEWPPTSHKQLFFAGNKTDIRDMFTRFLPRAYRRPVTKEEIDAIVDIVNDARTKGKKSLPEAVRTGLQRVLCSPNFLFLGEPTGKNKKPQPLTDYELASRLSYFLWSTMPDEELFRLAADGKLRDKKTVASQVTRMLADPKADQLVRNFAGQWLSVRDYGSIQPAANYRNYDDPLKRASEQEPYAFFAEVLNRDLSITNFLDSDFLVVNERLAKHYGIKGVKGPEFRRVKIGPEHHRGGVLGMAGLMTYLSDGTRTLPMRRGSWVLRELFNDPPNNPPPNAGEIQPNTAGKNLTVRQRLELHRNDAICASCHAKLDPYGLALENYDAIGEWRERANGEGFRGSRAPELDVSGTFPDGKKFTSLAEYKTILMSKKDRFARAFVTKMLTYALCRPIGYTDHKLVESLTSDLQKEDYRIRTLIQGIVASESFRTK